MEASRSESEQQSEKTFMGRVERNGKIDPLPAGETRPWNKIGLQVEY